ncbi:hypothetical protein [Garciella nitratireducens]|nr:hypothetical protein [Garciella nitratireducens]
MIASMGAGILIPEKSLATFYGISGIIAYLMFLFSMNISIENDLRRRYLFILPESPWKKYGLWIKVFGRLEIR